jgi:hypothetical protein
MTFMAFRHKWRQKQLLSKKFSESGGRLNESAGSPGALGHYNRQKIIQA